MAIVITKSYSVFFKILETFRILAITFLITFDLFYDVRYHMIRLYNNVIHSVYKIR